MRDMTEHQRATEQFHLAMEAAPTGMIMVERARTHRVVVAFSGFRRVALGTSWKGVLPERLVRGLAQVRSPPVWLGSS